MPQDSREFSKVRGESELITRALVCLGAAGVTNQVLTRHVSDRLLEYSEPFGTSTKQIIPVLYSQNYAGPAAVYTRVLREVWVPRA